MLCLVTGSLGFLEVMKTIKSGLPERGGCFGTYFSPFIACISAFQSSQPADGFIRGTEAIQGLPASLVGAARHQVQDQRTRSRPDSFSE